MRSVKGSLCKHSSRQIYSRKASITQLSMHWQRPQDGRKANSRWNDRVVRLLATSRLMGAIFYLRMTGYTEVM
jgi:hypothetical protein